MSHNINYKDHLGESLNNLRFSEQIWESDLFANSGFYTNRIPAVEMHQYFKNVGFNLIVEDYGRWDKLPINRKNLAREFKKFTRYSYLWYSKQFGLLQKKNKEVSLDQ